jgi:hypothetical protein
MSEQRAARLFVDWLERRLTIAGRGDDETVLKVEPSGKYWLGRLASETYVANLGLGDRGERLEPCATGLRVRPKGDGPWDFVVDVSMVVWLWDRQAREWHKSERLREAIPVQVCRDRPTQTCGLDRLTTALERVSAVVNCLAAEIRIELESHVDGGSEMAIMLVNVSPEEHRLIKDTRLYECELRVSDLVTQPFILESLPDSFRYDRRVAAYGINCGVEMRPNGVMATIDAIGVSKMRPRFWASGEQEPDLRFMMLAVNPVSAANDLQTVLGNWGRRIWSEQALQVYDRLKPWSWQEQDRRHGDAGARPRRLGPQAPCSVALSRPTPCV